jgi:hypothetical protein
MASLVVSSIGPFTLAYILMSKSGNSILYRDAIYTYLHFQYNGFFTLAVFTLFFTFLAKRKMETEGPAYKFSLFLSLSVVPALFLSLLWHNSILFYGIAGVGCIFILLSLFWFYKLLPSIKKSVTFLQPLAYTLWVFCAISFVLKMLMNVGTILPPLGNAVYGDRPIIIGFLHLVFLGFVTFYILSLLVEEGYFNKGNKTVIYPFVVFSLGIIGNEVILMVQGLGVLLEISNSIFNWLLWGISIVLFLGAVLMTTVRYRLGNVYVHKKEP